MADDFKPEDYTEEPNEMSFLDHLEELRWRIIKAVIGVVIGGIVCGIFIDWIMNHFLLAPALATNPPLQLINLKPYGQLVLYMEVILVGGLILSIPNVFYQFWKFIEPGLLHSERRYVSLVVFFTSFCFLGGASFAYYVMLPTALGFFAAFGTASIANNIAVDEYFSFIISVMLTAAIVFELPVVTFFLARFGVVTPKFMKKYRKHAFVIILILAAVLTPGPDITSQLMLGVPLFVLYEISIFIARIAQKQREK